MKYKRIVQKKHSTGLIFARIKNIEIHIVETILQCTFSK